MSWFPRFLNIWPAALAAGIVIPSLLLLYFLKLRRREMAVASTILWKKAIQDLQVNAPFQKLRKNLLLLLQLLLLILLLLALSRPITFFTKGAGKNTVVIIDHSASMQAMDADGHSRLDEAKRRAKNLIDTLDRGGNAMVIAFDDSAETVQPWSSDTAALKQAIDGIKSTDRASRLKQAYQLAEAQSNFNPEQLRANVEPPDVFVYSDGRVLDNADLSIKGNVTYEKIGSEKSGNIAIVTMSAKRNYEKPTEVEIFARLANYGPNPVKTDVELWVSPIDPAEPEHDHFENRGAESLQLIPERWTEAERAAAKDFVPKQVVKFTLDLPTAAVLRLDQKGEEGNLLAVDDRAQVVVPPPKPLSVLAVSEGNYYLELALSAINLKSWKIISPTEYEAAVPQDFDVIIFDRYSPNKLPSTGNFVYFGSLAADLRVKRVLDNAQPVMLSDLTVLDWERDHPLLRGMSLNSIYVSEAMKVDVPLDAEVLIEGTKGPLVIFQREGRAMHLILTFNILDSNWPIKPSFAAFMYNTMQYMALGSSMDIRQALEPGATPRIPRTNLVQALGDKKTIHLSGPGISRDLAIPAEGDFALPPLDSVGLYHFDPAVPQYERLAVNLLDENESNLMPVDRPPGNIGQASVALEGRSRLDLWWWLVACGALPLMLVEWWVYTRRVHL
jgi:hypothetical protein